jgi:hypothetical protein
MRETPLHLRWLALVDMEYALTAEGCQGVFHVYQGENADLVILQVLEGRDQLGVAAAQDLLE